MRIEKINENQIRCTLSREDLEQRNIRLSEFAYGTPKARTLFKEMLRWASYKYGFEAEDIPLVIEAIPVSADGIILIVTKVPYPDELDTRFSSFADLSDISSDMDEDYEDYDDISLEDFTSPLPSIDYSHTANDILKLFAGKNAKKAASESTEADVPFENVVRSFCFDTLDDAVDASRAFDFTYPGSSRLLKLYTDEYCLILSMDEATPEVFNRLCNILSEYSSPLPETLGLDCHLTEISEMIIPQDALQALSQL
ncbi:MAG: adaptor protein MecA [Lachnospiraceae bacterium]|nr:adaptor protein MecA [Lachnospiraceae bacterium]